MTHTLPTTQRATLIDDFNGYRYPVPRTYRYTPLPSEDEQWATLATIGIERRADTDPLSAWRDAVADASGINRAELDPATGRGLDLAFSPAYVRQFVWYLA